MNLYKKEKLVEKTCTFGGGPVNLKYQVSPNEFERAIMITEHIII